MINKKKTDPVCGMTLKGKDSLRVEYRGTEYYFCSPNCIEKFNMEPSKYINGKDECCQKGDHAESEVHHHSGHCGDGKHNHPKSGCHCESKAHH